MNILNRDQTLQVSEDMHQWRTNVVSNQQKVLGKKNRVFLIRIHGYYKGICDDMLDFICFCKH